MREVYRAKDTRFEREAKTLASISKAGGTVWSQESEGLGRSLEARGFLEAS